MTYGHVHNDFARMPVETVDDVLRCVEFIPTLLHPDPENEPDGIDWQKRADEMAGVATGLLLRLRYAIRTGEPWLGGSNPLDPED